MSVETTGNFEETRERAEPLGRSVVGVRGTCWNTMTELIFA
jgi:hypothetical protein